MHLKKIGRIIALIIATLVILSHLLPFADFRWSEKKQTQYFQDHDVAVEFKTYQADGKKIHFTQTLGQEKPFAVIFIHGSPGSSSSLHHFLTVKELSDHAQLIAVDRPGFGDSDFGKDEPSLEKQAEALKPLLMTLELQDKKIILVGHSLGSPLALKLALLYPSFIDSLVLVSTPLDPSLEPNYWYLKVLDKKIIRRILPRALRASFPELIALKGELEVMAKDLDQLTTPTTMIQGVLDRQVPVANIEYAKTHLINTPLKVLILDEQEHYIPWEGEQYIIDAVLDEMKE